MTTSWEDWLPLSPEVFVPAGPVAQVTGEVVARLKEQARASRQAKCRLLLHCDPDAALHEMVIVLPKGGYVQPHENTRSSKSYHLVDGSMVVVLFDRDGRITQVCRMGDRSPDQTRILRMSATVFHTVIPTTDQVVFVETILGPFRGTVYAPWAPIPQETDQAHEYFRKLCHTVQAEG